MSSAEFQREDGARAAESFELFAEGLARLRELPVRFLSFEEYRASARPTGTSA